jgi:DNA-directed RNA polymerase specialized sigma24 family protein
MADPGSVTVWLGRLRAGDREAAAGALWGRYFGRLVGLARDRLRTRPRSPAADEEDVALAAFDSFVRSAEAGRFPRLGDRDDLWQVLFVLTARKSADLADREAAAKRGGGRTAALSAAGFDPPAADPDPDPAEAAALADGLDHLLGLLGDDRLRRVAVMKMNGHTHPEIAAALGVGLATVERKVRTIREILTDAGLWADGNNKVPPTADGNQDGSTRGR